MSVLGQKLTNFQDEVPSALGHKQQWIKPPCGLVRFFDQHFENELPTFLKTR